MNVIDIGAELTVIQTLYNIIGVETVLGLGRGLDVPDDKLFAQSIGNGLGQHGFAGAGFSLDQERLFQGHGDIDSFHQLFCRDIG